MLSESADRLEEHESLDLFGLSRFFERRGDSTRAQIACAQALAMGLPGDVRVRAQKELALMAKRRGEHQRAATIWEEMVRDPQDEGHACEQLAIYYEHRVKDLQRAIEYAKLGLAKVKRQRTASLRNARDPDLAARLARREKRFIERLARLERKAPPRSSPAPRQGAPAPAEPKANRALW